MLTALQLAGWGMYGTEIELHVCDVDTAGVPELQEKSPSHSEPAGGSEESSGRVGPACM